MAKTLEALQKAEEERKDRSKAFDFSPKIGELKITPEFVVENQRLKNHLLQLTSDRNVRAILFSSCNGGEGTSTVLINFAHTLVSAGEKVLLVDANLRRPSLHAVFHLEKENGFTDLLLGRSPLAGVIKQTEFSNLGVIPSGTPCSNPTIILESDALKAHVEQMKEKTDWVLFDSSPIARFMDPVVLAPKLDGMVMVVEAEKTRWEVAENSRQRVIGGNGRVLGVVLNKRRYHVPMWLYNRL